MGFAKNLGKGLIRSAVNQVGRDAGKVISNQLYGNAHSTSHRIVNNNDTFISDKSESVGEYIKEQTAAGVVWRIIFAFIFNFIGGPILIIYGLKKKSKANFVSIYKYEEVATYVRDRRFKTGVRHDGYITVKKKCYALADEYTINRNRRIANIYIWSGIAITIICWSIYWAFIINAL
ncbi:hypothetical protein [Prevotella intermedia]|uniref:hypothetical protein n=1 Tax=Prevotella intermedia TaxID=28131 RepID=UPI0020034CAA|nr:hypothetical protein [Prevotella intermedia]MCK6144816.1 hypothetical protein [Prevotella intermedia]